MAGEALHVLLSTRVCSRELPRQGPSYVPDNAQRKTDLRVWLKPHRGGQRLLIKTNKKPYPILMVLLSPTLISLKLTPLSPRISFSIKSLI